MAEFAHLPQDVRPIAALDAEARIAHIRTERWVQHAAADRVLGYLQEAFQQPPRERMENILLVGESGMGKTMLVRKFERQNAAPFDDVTGIQHKPVVVMLMPHQPTEGQFFNQLLHALNAPSPGHFSRGFPVQDPAVRLLRQLGTRVVVIDELNSLLAGTPRQQRVFLQLLRFLSNELRIAFVGVGVPEARHALLSDSQLRSRFTDIELSPWRPARTLARRCRPGSCELGRATTLWRMISSSTSLIGRAVRSAWPARSTIRLPPSWRLPLPTQADFLQRRSAICGSPAATAAAPAGIDGPWPGARFASVPTLRIAGSSINAPSGGLAPAWCVPSTMCRWRTVAAAAHPKIAAISIARAACWDWHATPAQGPRGPRRVGTRRGGRTKARALSESASRPRSIG